MKNFVKAMNKQGEGFPYLKQKFPGLSDEKIRAGVFVGPQIRDLLSDDVFVSKLTSLELAAWDAFKQVVQNFLGINRADNYAKLIDNMLENYQKMGCRMSCR